MDSQAVSQFITSIGFPIFVAVWMLWKSDEQESKTQSTLNELKIAIVTLTDVVNHLKGKNDET